MSSALAPDKYIGRFRIEAVVGRGGMGIVLRATDPSLNRRVALKLLAPHLWDSPQVLARFRREAAAIAGLKHPHIASVYEFGEHQGRPFIALEWVDGRTLTALLEAENHLPLDRALSLFDQLGEALDYAHARGVIHRDIKPSNIIIGPDDNATLVDFGLASMTGAAAITASSDVMGTPAYMSPEQFAGRPLDGRSDLYSLAVVLFEMLTGRRPFEAETGAAHMHAHLTSPPPPITEIDPSLPRAVETALLKAMAKEPAQRYETARAMGLALRGREPVQIVPWLGFVPQRILVGRKRWASLILLGLGAAALTGLLWFWSRAGSIFGSPPDQVHATLTVGSLATSPGTYPTLFPTLTLTPITPVAVEGPKPDGSWPMIGGAANWCGFVPEGLGAVQSLPRWSRSVPSGQDTGIVAGRGLVISVVNANALRALDWTTGLTTWETSSFDSDVTASPALFTSEGGGILLILTQDETLYAVNANDGTLLWKLAATELHGVIHHSLTVGSDGMAYAATDQGWLDKIDPTAGQVQSFDFSSLDTFSLAPALSGSMAYLSGDDQALHAMDVDLGQAQWRAETLGVPTTSPCVDETLGQVVIGTDKGWVQAYSSENGTPIWKARISGPIVGLASDGSRIYAAATDGSLSAWEAKDGQTVWNLNTGTALAKPPLTDGTYVLLGTESGELLSINAGQGSPANERRIRFPSPVESIAPAGGWLFIQGGSSIYGFGP